MKQCSETEERNEPTGKEDPMRIQLSSHFTYRKLVRFTLPTIAMMLFTSLYSIVDGIFVSNFVGKTALAAVNLIWPVVMGLSSVGFMMGTGGSAIVAKTLGEGKQRLAQEYFSLILFAALGAGLGLSTLGFVLTPQIAQLLGATGQLLSDTVLYGRILFLGLTAYMLQVAFQSFFVAAERPDLNLKITLAAGLTNMILDGVFVGLFRWGLAGAGAATVLGQLLGGLVPLVYFARKNNSLLRLLPRVPFRGRVLGKTCLNGSSEMVTNLSSSLVGTLYNLRLMALVGQDGVAAYGVIMYIGFVFAAIFFGYAMGSAPLISYHYGAENHGELSNLLRKSLRLAAGMGLVMTLSAEGMAPLVVGAFTKYDAGLYEMTLRGFRLCSLAFLMMGVNVWGSAFFTALNNGGVSAAISFLRTFVFQVAAVLLLSHLLALDGIWLALPAAELPALAVTAAFLMGKRKRYQY